MGSPGTFPPFQAFGPDHLAALAVTFLVGWFLIFRARRYPLKTATQDRLLAVFLLALYPAHLLISWQLDSLDQDNALPCHLCDVAALCGAAALWFKHQRLAELVWFWGLAGTLNGLITPALAYSFPSPHFLFFFGLHGGVVVAAMYLVLGLRLQPQTGAVWRAFGWAQLYLLGASGVNLLTGSNYGFLREKPAQASLLDFMGPWPWYILGLEALGLVFFTLLYLPFYRPPARIDGGP